MNMVFQFEHVAIDHGPYGKYTENRFRLSDLIRVMSKWQEGLSGVGWNSLYWENHDPASLGFPIRKRFNPVSMGKISENAGDLPAYAARNTLYLPRAVAWNDES